MGRHSDAHLRNISSIEILKSPESISLTSINGATVQVSTSVSRLADLNLNDKLASAVIPEGWKVRFFVDVGYSGGYYTREAGTHEGSFFGTISSIEVLERPPISTGGSTGGGSTGGGGWPPGIRPPQVHSIEESDNIDESATYQLNIDPETAFMYAKLTSAFYGLEGPELAKAILETSGKIGVDVENGVIYSTETVGGLLGKNVYDITKLAFDVDDENISSAHVQYTQIAFENLLIDNMYPYGSLNNLKATVLNRVAYESLDTALLEQIGTGSEPFVLDQLADLDEVSHIDFEALTIELVEHMFSQNGITNVNNYNTARSTYNYLIELDNLTQLVEEEEAVVVAYEGDEAVKSIPLTDELFARAQLFKYGMNADAVEGLWKKYLKAGALKFISDSRITSNHLAMERQLSTGDVQDMWSAHFNTIVPVSAKYLSTLIEVYLKLSGKESFGDDRFNSVLRLVHGFEIQKFEWANQFQGMIDRWDTEPDNWIIYGPTTDYSIKTAGNIFDIMAVSGITIEEKLPFYSSQSNTTQNLKLFEHINATDTSKYCTKNDWEHGFYDKMNKWECSPHYITRGVNSLTVQEAYEHILAETMKHQKWGLKTVQTNRDILYMVLQMFIPVWGTVEAAQRGDNTGMAMGILGDVMFFLPIAGVATASAIKPAMKVLTKLKPKFILGKGASYALSSVDDMTGGVVQLNKVTARAAASQAIKNVARQTISQLNPLDGVGNLARGAKRSIHRKMSGVKATNTAPSVPKVYTSRDLELTQIDQSSVDVTTGVGMPTKDRIALAEVADKENIVLGVRPVDEKSRSLIESGLYGSKSLLVKSKSSDWGPHSGFIPVNQKYAKKSARNNVEKFNLASKNSLDMNVAVESPLVITDARLRELQGFGAVEDLRLDSATDMYVAKSKSDGIEMDFYYEKTDLSGQDGWNIYIKEDGQLTRLNVMGSPESDKAMTADYDLFTVMYHNSDFGTENILRKPKTHEEWKASINYDDLSPELKDMYNDKELYDVKGAGRFGTISDRVLELKDKINSQLGRGKGMEMVHHGADDANPYAVTADNFPATFFVPNRLLAEDGLGKGMGSIQDYFPVDVNGTVILRNPEEFANFHQVVINTHFTGPLNTKWAEADQAGEILSRRARMSHIFLNARDQIAKELGASVGNYRPYYPN